MRKLILIDDDPDEIYFFEQACSKLTSAPEITSFFDANEFLTYLGTHRCNGSVILLDLNMPDMGGLELLKKIAELGVLHNLIVLIYTTSVNAQDIKESYQLGAKSYLSKPSSINELTALLQSLSDYWFNHNSMPV
ncbi:response regulator [Pseudoalteromonas luteoviolacea]|uniref:Response regulatory domain-containing protein n=1 Tax=Pseudoalteromonas luteoviolacea S4054 TaxID=1129367 RepID=A0A0F6A650_9GAMM|nr:response regulator [Pseudoalteromonas luteoviolacea]AOT08150.1 hypothetical protein S4054249_09965 [Pseudoalteromonas luteoviolacea]AOT13067.1 hypothetical protein S40542_09965 [Pseudoalteromonas luteoviolacea]AOT17979.1 hypothetical protein S4054_09960 [Pseudoalteromonas luteoviolacea]KKE81650.1 hypothetical protein N479_21755 [Pseudoalteromonas luteoviolacea S4054]KZN69483.1 hypothetical protein N481_22085 [Pseudoalteromonas luteoviolacea S4047-1]